MAATILQLSAHDINSQARSTANSLATKAWDIQDDNPANLTLADHTTLPERKRTSANVKTLQEAILIHNKQKPPEKAIWRALGYRDVSRQMRHFLFLAVHGEHRIGYFWKHFCPERMNCSCCNAVETLEHILVLCSRPWVKLIWNVAHSIWLIAFGPWPDISFGTILGCGLMSFKDSEGSNLPEARRLFKIIVTECAHLIWKMRCETVIGEKSIPSRQEIYNRVVAAINACLKRDLLDAKRKKLPMRYASRNLISQTWQHVIIIPSLEEGDAMGQEESWMDNTGVLVGVEPLSTLDPTPTGVG
ncbi:hypothetical protein PQX77_013874 [Marasmius sp. AFHP31]|nr:hypothetical protein PQX77_013874 [Marasmius sp. AFHP31]